MISYISQNPKLIIHKYICSSSQETMLFDVKIVQYMIPIYKKMQLCILFGITKT